ncbi:hypothetical protein SISNIDRAFT_481279 [Sistotremastrum niveocremeum HHB9708]|uniref:THO1-MOS11 C-terminal domain-containing protein n=1 Tax=Sistotremastrum niveocremeum HHB9708 TaxID=1314777 RepID=A0A165A6T7_9AGAM|nr:hypothetical protein SISNIDRAFT_481279 [Sistotremastrum niveocremeum HHB9708]
MEAKLKTLKVVDLKQILTKANVTVGAKANKADLVAKILASPEALRVANGDGDEHTGSAAPAVADRLQDDDLLAPPEDIDWDISDPTPSAPVVPPPTAASTTSAKPVSAAAPPVQPPQPSETPAAPSQDEAEKPAVEPSNGAATVEAAAAKADEEAEKRKARAARFGIPVVEPKAPKPPRQPKAAAKEQSKADAPKPKAPTQPKAAVIKTTVDDTEKVQKRAERFGLNKPTAPSTGEKRSRASIAVDEEEEEKRKKRAARFGASVSSLYLSHALNGLSSNLWHPDSDLHSAYWLTASPGQKNVHQLLGQSRILVLTCASALEHISVSYEDSIIRTKLADTLQ